MVYFSGVELSDSSRPCSIRSGRISQRLSMVQWRPLATATGGIARFSVVIEVNIIFSNKIHELNTLKLPKKWGKNRPKFFGKSSFKTLYYQTYQIFHRSKSLK